MKVLLLSACCLLAGLCLPAQNASLTVYFDSNVSVLSKAQCLRIDSFIAALPNIPEAFTAEVSGHTDNQGSLQLNMPLSKRRAQAVAGYLQSRHFRTTDSTLGYYAFNRPAVENTEATLWKNRRVEIRVQLRKLDMPAILGIKDFGPRKYNLIEDIGGTLTYDSTKIVIAPNAFTHRDGSEVTGEIEVSYQEFRTPADFILSGIPMSFKEGSDTRYFNSGGMFNVRVYQNGEELVLKKAADKRIQIDFPLTDNLADMGFFQFDTLSQQWNKDNVHRMTDQNGNLVAPFGIVPGTPGNNSSEGSYLECLNGGDTCSYIAGMVAKIEYFLSHEEPIRLNYPYKFVKNNVVDFKSPFYRIDIDTATRSIRFISQNSYDRFGKFANYTWTFDQKTFDKTIRGQFRAGSSFVKVVYKGKNRFLLEIEDRAFYADGQPAGFSGSGSKLKRINKKNFKSYLKYTYDLDNKQKQLEQTLRERLEKYNDNLNALYVDSLKCLNSFYRELLYTTADTKVEGLADFNLHRDIVAEKMKPVSKPFRCSDTKKLIWRKDSINKAVALRIDSLNNFRKKAFARFGIDATGIYNADAIKKIGSPVEVYAAYTNEQGKPLSVISVFISIKGIKGAIKYDGYAGYSPSKFVYGSNDECSIVAVDENLRSYFCDPEEFRKAVSAGQHVIFKLKSAQQLESKSNLEKLVDK